MASRGFPGVLESVPLNTLHDAHPPLKKRKTSHDEARNPAGSAIVIRVSWAFSTLFCELVYREDILTKARCDRLTRHPYQMNRSSWIRSPFSPALESHFPG